MSKRALVAVVMAAALLSAGIAAAQNQAPWLHIRVTEAGEDGARVNVNLPLSLIEVFADIAESEIREGRHLDIDMDHHDVTIEDIRRAWAELRDAGDAEFVEIEDDNEYVKISRTGDRILIELDDRDDNDNGRIEVPVSVVDALLSGDGEQLDIRAALDELVAVSDGEIVFIEDDETTVRIWIE